MKILVFFLSILINTSNLVSGGYDDPFTSGINEGAVGTGYDDPFTSGINEGAIGTGYDDPFTSGINEGSWK